jgi:hypothetical protein
MSSKIAAAPLDIKTDVSFAPEQQELCLRCLRSLHDLMPVLDRAEACGIDCQRYRAIADEETRILEAIRANFMTPLEH